jgi:hypothetical protein
MSLNIKWVKLLVFFISILFLSSLVPVVERQQIDLEKDIININPPFQNNPTRSDSNINHQTRARYLDDVIDLDDPEVQLTVFPENANDCNFGNSPLSQTIATGDIDNDGYNDLILGVPFGDGVAENVYNSGEVLVTFGGQQTHPDTLYDKALRNTNEFNIIIYGPGQSDWMGFSVACGNIDGDEYDDIILGAPYGDGKAGGRLNSGEVYVIYGDQRQYLGTEINLRNTAPDIIIYGAAGGAWPNYDVCGYSLSVGNVIGDSKDDIIIGAPYGNRINGTNCGKVHVVAGNTRGSLGTEIDLSIDSDVTMFGATADDYVGFSVASGDINGDARDDIIASSYAADPYGTRTNGGAAYIIYGDQTLPSIIDLNNSADVSFFGATVNDYYGWALAVGNINGDQYEDLLVSALYGDGNNDAITNSGDLYIKFGAPNLLSQYDLTTDGYDVTLYGKNSWDYFGYSLATGNVNNDQYDDFLIGVYGGDGDQNGNSNSGEAYLLLGNSTANLGTNLDPLGDAETVFYGIDTTDYMGRYVHLGDFDGDNHDDIILFAPFTDGLNNARSNAGEFYTIYSRPPPMENEFVEIIDGDIDNKTVLSKFKPYSFKVNVSNILGQEDIRWVNFIIDPDDYNISLKWTRVGLEFFELYDPNDYVEMISSGADTKHDTFYNYSIDFRLIFNWTFNKTGPIDCKVISVGDRSLPSENEFEDVFKVNNKLDIIGDLKLSGAVQGNLKGNDWIKGGEVLTFRGLKVVYYNTTEFYPGVSDYTIGIDESGELKEYLPTIAGEEINLKYTSISSTGDYNYKIKIMSVPEYSDRSSIDIDLKVDADAPIPPGSVVCKADSKDFLYESKVDDDNSYFVIWTAVTDVGSGTAGYYYSLEDFGGTEDGIWTSSTSTEILNATEGENSVYVWAQDSVGNIGLSTKCQIFIDLTELTFANFEPISDDWFTTENISCCIQILDEPGFGVDPESIWYWDMQTNKWVKLPSTNSTDPNMYNISLVAQMNNGEDSFIKFRASDLAGNGPTESASYYFKIDAKPVTFSDVEPDPTKKLNSVRVKCYMTINDLDGSGVDPATIQYSYSTSGLGNFSEWTNDDLALITNVPNPQETSRWFVELNYRRGAENYIRWRAKDLAGNGYTESDNYQIRINAFPNVRIQAIDKSITYTSKMELTFNAEDTTDPDDVLDGSAFTWSSNKTGTLGVGKVINTKLSSGIHHITLIVFDGQSNSSAGFNITVEEPKSPSSSTSDGGTSIFGFDEDTSFLFLILIVIIIIIILVFLVVFRHERKKRQVLEKKALGLDVDSTSTYIPSRAPTITPSEARAPQLYDATVTPSGITGVDGTYEQLPTTVTGGAAQYSTTTQTQPQRIQQLPAAGGTTPETTPAPTPTATTPTPTPTTTASPGAAPVYGGPSPQAHKPQLPPASVMMDSQTQQQTTEPQGEQPTVSGTTTPQPTPTSTSTTPDSETQTGPVFGEPYPSPSTEVETLDIKTPPDISIPPDQVTLPETEEIPQELEPMDGEPQQLTQDQPDKSENDEKGEPDLPLGLTPDSPEYQKRLKKDENENQ